MRGPLLLTLLLASCARPATTPTAPAPDELRATCCAQCREAARRDPAGRDLSLDPCARWASDRESPVNTRCARYLADADLKLMDCSGSQP